LIVTFSASSSIKICTQNNFTPLGKFDRVPSQIDKHLPQTTGVTDQALWATQAELMAASSNPFSSARRAKCICNTLDRRAQVKVNHFKFELFSFDL
jgi:hypothetical protein